MQPYLIYGFGIRAGNLPAAQRQRLLDASPSKQTFSWFAEEGAGTNAEDSGIFYLVRSSPWSRDEETGKLDAPWAADLTMLTSFQSETQSLVEERLQSLDLLDYADKVEFLCSVTEV